MNTKQTVSILLLAVTIGGIGFYGGSVYAKQKASSTKVLGARNGAIMPSAGAGQRVGRQAGSGAFGAMTTGKVLTKDATGLVIELQDVGSKNVLFASSTQIMQMTTVSLDAVTEGAQVMISGSTNTDGSITASRIQLMPEGQSPVGGFGTGTPRPTDGE